MRSPAEIAELMLGYPLGPNQQIAQTAFRQKLVESWGICEGQMVLEIGCGQGDMTAVLADAVGESGQIVAVDLADRNYGAPVTLGDSMDHLMAGPLGGRLDVRFGFDVLEAVFNPGGFDAVVLAHCTWYFESLDQLAAVLAKARPWTRRLCLSEWDMQPRSIDQLGHFLAVLVQGQVESFNKSSEANIRTPYTREKLREVLAGTGWQVEREELVDASRLDDGKWEIDMALDASSDAVPDCLRSFIEMQQQILAEVRHTSLALPSYAIVAT